MTQLRSRLLKLESTVGEPLQKRATWLCARVPADAPKSKLDALAEEAAKLDCAFHSYTYNGPVDYRGDELPEMYVLHPLKEVPAKYATEFVRKARNAQHS